MTSQERCELLGLVSTNSSPILLLYVQPYHTTKVRILLWGHYRIVYVPKLAQEVHVVGVFHGVMELKRYLS